MHLGSKIAVVIPCYRVTRHVLDVIAGVPPEVDVVICVDDACPDNSGHFIETHVSDPRVRVIRHPENQGVGGAVKTGYRAAVAAGCDIAVKVDGDGQMDPRLVLSFVYPIALGQCDYTKGNRFFRPEDVRSMPGVRFFGNAVLSFLSKISTGYWNIFDPTNGYTALHLAVLNLMPLEKVANSYFFESDLLFRLNIARCVVRDVPMRAIYADERSNLRSRSAVVPFFAGHMRNFFKRIFYSYFLRDFNVASVEIFLGPTALVTGILFAAYHWMLSVTSGISATAGTVMIPGLLIIVGLQLCLSALAFDVSNVPSQPVHPLLTAMDVKGVASSVSTLV